MRKAMLLAVSLTLCGMSGAYSAPAQSFRLRPMAAMIVPDRVTPLYERLSTRLTPRGRAWVVAQSQRLRSDALDPSLVAGEASQTCATAFNACNGGADIEALAFVVLMQATSDQDQDLLAIMAEAKATAKAKAARRNTITHRNVLSARQINQDYSDIKNDLDSMNEMSEMTSMRLQMAMDRRSKFVEALTNVLKKIEETDSTIIQSIK